MPQSASTNLAKPETTPSTLVAYRLRIGRFGSLLILTVLFGLYALQLWLHITRTSATYDEPFHILAGYRYWQCGDYGINPEHPPLLKLLATLPIESLSPVEPSWRCGSKVTPKMEGFIAGAQFLAENGVDQILIPTRLAASLMSLLLAVLVFLAAREMFGQVEAFLASGLLIFEPNIIAHGSLVTTDMSLTTTAFAAVYALYRYCRKPGVLRLLLVGAATGLMLASKHSAIIMLPLLFLLLIADIFLTRRNKAETGTRLSRKLLYSAAVYAAIFLIGLAVLWAAYGFRYNALPSAAQAVFTRRAYILPESYVYGLKDIILASEESTTYLLGKIYSKGQWLYFPLAFTIKTSIALLLLLPPALLRCELYRKYPREMLFLLVPSLAFFAISLTSHINIGVRHILPIYPFFISVAAAGGYALARRSRVFLFALVVLLLFHASTAVRTAPNYIAFANDFWGGMNNTHRFLHDSNVDWGQNLKLVEAYLKKEGIRDCWFAYFGPGDLARVNKTCHLMPARGWTYTEQVVEPLPPLIEGTVLLSTDVLPPHDAGYEAVAKTKPVAILGGSIHVYRGHFEVPLAAAFSHMGRSGQFLRLDLIDEAIAECRKAVELAPHHPGPHLFLGVALASADKTDEARRELEAAILLAQSNLDQFRGLERQAQHVLQLMK